MLKKLPVQFPSDNSIRVIICTDCNCECDDQYMVVHALMTPRFDVKAVIGSHYMVFPPEVVEDSALESYNEIEHITSLMGIRDEVNILRGSATEMQDCSTPAESEGAKFIVEEAMREDARPLFVAVTGAITEVASAYIMEPKIADKLTVIWIGGGKYPNGNFEYNQNGDLNASRVIYRSNLELWQVPDSTYIQMRISYFELLEKIYPCGEIGKYLVENTMRVGQKVKAQVEGAIAMGIYDYMSKGDRATFYGSELWHLGDSPTIGLMLCNDCGRFHEETAPTNVNDDGTYDWTVPGTHKIRVYDDIDCRFILDDLEAKLSFFFRQ